MKTESAVSLDDLELLESLCRRHENATSENERDIRALLGEITGPTRSYFLRELLWQDIEFRQRKGEAISDLDYSLSAPEDARIVDEVLNELKSGASVPSEQDTHPPLELPSRYRSLEKVGQGGIGTIWRAQDLHSQRPLAIKILRKQFRNARQANLRLEREAMLTGMLQHPGIPPVHDHGKLADGSSFFAMKLVDGVTFEEILRNRQPDDVGFQKIIDIFQQVAQTMAYVHSQGVIHRDLKPQNIMVGKFSEVQVMDWGMAKRLNVATPSTEHSDLPQIQKPDSQTAVSPTGIEETNRGIETINVRSESSFALKPTEKDELTQIGDLLGTPSYMSPEQARGELNRLGTRSDVYSLGVILFEILTDSKIHADASTAQILDRVTSGDLSQSFTRLDDCNADSFLIDLCKRCLATDPAARPQHAGEIADALNEHFTNTQTRIKTTELELREAEVRAKEETKRRKTLGLMLGLVATVFAAGFVGVMWQWNKAKAAGELAEKNADNFQQAAVLAEKNANNYQQGLRVFVGAFNSVRPESGSNATMSAKEVLVQARQSLEDSDLDAEGRMAMLHELQGCFRAIGEFELALVSAQDSMQLHQEHFGDRDLKTIRAMYEVAIALEKVGKLEEALPLTQATLELCLEELGENHEVTLATMSALAKVYGDQGNWDPAVVIYEELFEREKKVFGDQHQNTLVAMGRLAEGYQSLGRYDDALALSEKSLELKKLEFGEDHPSTLTAMNNLAIAYTDLGRTDDALALNEKTLELKIAKLGEDHPDTLTTMGNLGLGYGNAGRFEDALRVNEKTLRLKQGKLGADHPQTFVAMNNLALTYKSLGRLEEALELQLKTLNLQQAKFDEDHPWNLILLGSIAFTYGALDQLDKALEMHLKALELKTKKLGPKHPQTLKSINNVAFTYQELERLDEAQSRFEESLLLHQEVHGDEQSATHGTMNSLAEIYEAKDRLEEAESLLKKCLTLRQARAPEAWLTYNTQSQYGGVLLKLGKVEASVEHLSAGFTGLERVADTMPVGARADRQTRALLRLIKLAEIQDDAAAGLRWEAKLAELDSDSQKRP